MDVKEAKFFKASLDNTIPHLDLHGFYPQEALEKLELFLFNELDKKQDTARIIYGGGTGRLREEVLGCLKKHVLVDSIKDEGGSCVVLLNNF